MKSACKVLSVIWYHAGNVSPQQFRVVFWDVDYGNICVLGMNYRSMSGTAARNVPISKAVNCVIFPNENANKHKMIGGLLEHEKYN